VPGRRRPFALPSRPSSPPVRPHRLVAVADRLPPLALFGFDDIVTGQHLLIFRDITEKIERDWLLQETKPRLEPALESTGTGVFEWRVDTDQIDWSTDLEAMVGLDPGEFEGIARPSGNAFTPTSWSRSM
jgi:PAS domain-containing protein